ncbi:hypothetical protein K438DRAFT_835699 [Mycena galopus ATCC 62051]|nr:hypothetical protein K438DRAFT_835699 [Mycena galopus ATCC 62051]
MKSDELGEESCRFHRFSRRGCVRRIYSARLGGSESQRMTVATYHGPDAQEQLQRHILNYESIRHPNIMQLYGIAINGGLAAMVFHDDLIPYKQFLSRFRHSLILTTYIVGHCSMEYEEASDYLRSLCPRRPLYYDERTFWIRRSTGHLCADLTADWRRRKLHFTPGYFRDDSILRLGSFALEDPNFEAMIISSITEDDYHRLCSRYPMVQSRDLTISTQATIRPGAIIFCSTPQPEALFEIAHCPHLAFEASAWNNTGEATGRAGTVMANSWIRYSYRGAHADYIDADMWAFTAGNTKPWMTQANHIFSRLRTTSDFDNYSKPQ